MKYIVTAMRDKLSGFAAPIIEQTQEHAIRNFRYAMAQKDSMMAFQPADFDLYQIGEYDTDDGRITPTSPVRLIVNGESIRED